MASHFALLLTLLFIFCYLLIYDVACTYISKLHKRHALNHKNHALQNSKMAWRA